uniref:Uncharacterized protein n=1 Tax=Pseudomonas phage PACT201 TaxID=3230130 RepID=A0AAU8GVP6_9VIRU
MQSRVHQKADGLLMVNARGKSRFMNWRERLARWLLKGCIGDSAMSERYRVEQTGKGFWPYCVRAGNGTRDLYVGHKKTCDRSCGGTDNCVQGWRICWQGTLRRPSRRGPGAKGGSRSTARKGGGCAGAKTPKCRSPRAES